MPTFLDESGDGGVGERCSDFFRLAAVWLEHVEEVEACRLAIAGVRKDVLRVPKAFEFKFSRINPGQRTAFFEGVAGLPFRFVVCSIAKRRADARALTKDHIYRTAAEAVAGALCEFYRIAEACKGSPLNERVSADHTNDPVYFGHLRAAFLSLKSERKSGAGLVKSVKPVKSHADDLIQLVDMVCGAVGRSLDGDRELYRIIQGKRIDVIEWP